VVAVGKQARTMDEQELQTLYSWIDEIPLSRAKKNLHRDFSDGGMISLCDVTMQSSSADPTYIMYNTCTIHRTAW
jgi:hypothetical protein